MMIIEGVEEVKSCTEQQPQINNNISTEIVEAKNNDANVNRRLSR